MLNELANCKQQGQVTGYIDRMKRIAQKLPNITDDELLDRFIRGLCTNIQKEVLKEDPSTFEKACLIAERCARLDSLI